MCDIYIPITVAGSSSRNSAQSTPKMKSFIVLALCVAAAVALPVDDYKNAEIVKQVLDNIGVEGFNWAYETSDGKAASESAVLKNVGTENEGIEVRGQYSYVDNGVVYTVEYVANDKGFQPSGAHLPKL